MFVFAIFTSNKSCPLLQLIQTTPLWSKTGILRLLLFSYTNLDEDDFKILRKQKIDGQTFPDMTERKFMKDGIKRGPAMKLEKQAKILKERTRAFEKGKIKYFWLFPCGI